MRKKTKADLAKYLAATAVLKKHANSPKLVITSSSGHTRSNRTLQLEEKNHEEADTLMICLAAAAYPSGVLELEWSSSVLILTSLYWLSNNLYCVRWGVKLYSLTHFGYCALWQACKNTAISTVSGVVEIAPIWGALVEEKTAALHVFHAFTGADTVLRTWQNEVVSTVREGW